MHKNSYEDSYTLTQMKDNDKCEFTQNHTIRLNGLLIFFCCVIVLALLVFLGILFFLSKVEVSLTKIICCTVLIALAMLMISIIFCVLVRSHPKKHFHCHSCHRSSCDDIIEKTIREMLAQVTVCEDTKDKGAPINSDKPDDSDKNVGA